MLSLSVARLVRNPRRRLLADCRVPASAVVALPAGLTLREAMALGTAGFTAAIAVQRMEDNGQKPEFGQSLVTGATGGVGSFAIDMLRRAGL